MSHASKLKGATASFGSVYVMEGVYPALWVEKVQYKNNRQGQENFIVNLKILDSQVEERPAGTEMTWIVPSRFDSADGNIKSFYMAVLGIDEAEFGELADDKIDGYTDDNTLCGKLVRLEANTIKTKSDKDFTLCSYKTISEDQQAHAADLHEAAGFSS